jgi:hypothetical protein
VGGITSFVEGDERPQFVLGRTLEAITVESQDVVDKALIKVFRRRGPCLPSTVVHDLVPDFQSTRSVDSWPFVGRSCRERSSQ